MSARFHLFLVLATILSPHGQAANILVTALTIGSPWMDAAKIAEVLSSRGHVVTVVAPASQKNELLQKWPAFRYVTFGDPDKPPQLEQALKLPQQFVFSPRRVMATLSFYSALTSGLMEVCKGMMSDKRLLSDLQNSHYDVVLDIAIYSCGSLMAQYLNLPLVCLVIPLAVGSDIRVTGVPFPPSYVPWPGSELSDRMTFLQRVKNVLMYGVLYTTLAHFAIYDDVASRTIGPNFTMFDALTRTDVWLYRSGAMIDFPRPLMPNMVSIAGHIAEDVTPLSQELENFVQSSGDNGVVLVTFGSIIAHMPLEIADMLAAAFARLPQKVVWRYAGEPPSNLGPNTKTMDWVPQNDLLAHPKLKAFISHGGSHGIIEAMYHGVTLVGMPMLYDQHDNIARLVARGMAVSLDIHSVTSEEVYQTIKTVISDPRYKKNANKVSSHLRDQPQSPMERAVWWIEHVIRHSGLPHLRSRAAELPFYQYYLLDVLALIVSLMAAILLTCWKCCLFTCGMCKRGNVSPKAKTN